MFDLIFFYYFCSVFLGTQNIIAHLSLSNHHLGKRKRATNQIRRSYAFAQTSP